VPNSGSVELSGPAGGNDIRNAVDEDRQNGDLDASSSVEKRCTLTSLAAMSSPRSGLGATVLNGCLVAVGTLPQSL